MMGYLTVFIYRNGNSVFCDIVVRKLVPICFWITHKVDRCRQSIGAVTHFGTIRKNSLKSFPIFIYYKYVKTVSTTMYSTMLKDACRSDLKSMTAIISTTEQNRTSFAIDIFTQICQTDNIQKHVLVSFDHFSYEQNI